MPKLHATNIQRLAKVAANIGIATALGLALGATPVTEALKEAPGAEWVRERLTSVAVSLCTDMLRHAAGGLLIGELGKGEKADPDVLLSALPELLVAGINAIFVGPGSRSGPATRTGKPMRLLLIVDGIDAAHTVGPPSLRRLEPVVTLVCKVANPDQSRVLLGGRHAMPRLAVALARPIIHDAVSRFERSSVTAILGKTPLPADRREAIVAALCPETADTTPAKALHAAWTHRQELPPAALAEDLTRLARCLGPGVHSDKKLTRAAERSFGRVRTRDLLTELGRQPYVWIWKDGEAWRVSGLIA
jgi:hypothetical protein